MRRLALACAFALIAGSAAADPDKLFCFVEHSAGFTTEAIGSWTAVSFKTDGRYHLRPATEAERAQNKILNGRAIYFLSSQTTPSLETPCSRDEPTKTLRCDGVDVFRLNEETGRFVVYFLHGYIDSLDDRKRKNDAKNAMDDEDTPLIELGLCAKEG
jgi:hypothetical protein